MRFFYLFVGIFWLSFGFAEEIAFLPYRIDVPSKEFPLTLGTEYAKLLATAGVIAKLDVHSPRDIELDLQKSGINPQKTVSAEDLVMLGKSRLIDYYVVGTLYKKAAEYISESALFSVKKESVVAKTRATAFNLLQLAERELWQLFPHKAHVPRMDLLPTADVAMVVDCSYRVASEWNSIGRGLIHLAQGVTANWNVGARVSIVPFSKMYTPDYAILYLKNAYAFARAIESFSPKGGSDAKSFDRAFSHAVSNLSWRNDANKLIVVLSNTPISDSFTLRNAAQKARQKGIVVHTIALGDVHKEARDYLMELSKITNGDHFDVAYYRTITNARGEKVYLYFEAGRLFTTYEYDDRWMEGLLDVGKSGVRSAKPKKFLKEIFFDEHKIIPAPTKMAAMYQQYVKDHIVDESPLKSNVERMCANIAGKIQFSSIKSHTPLGRVLVAQGTHSLWIDIVKKNDLEFFRNKVKSKQVFLLGVSVEEKRDEPFGFRFNPLRYVTISEEYVPNLLKVRLEDICSNYAEYISRGLFDPPIWFVELTADRIKFKKRTDVRDE